MSRFTWLNHMLSSKRNLFAITLLLVGVHSLLLGFFILFMTDFFYELFFSTQVVNPFFVKQAGLFLILMGFFYLVPLTNLEKLSRVTLVTIITKVCAVTFLIVNANVSSAPFMIYFAGFGDACMAIALSVTYVMFVREISSKSLSY